MRRALLIIALLFLLSVNLPAARAVKVGRNIDIRGESLPDRQVVEPSIAVDPRNPDIIVAAATDWRTGEEGGWPGYYRSIDGGVTWSSSLIPGFPGDASTEGLTSPLRHFDAGGDVQVAFDSSGNLYYGAIIVNKTDAGFPIFSSFTPFVAKYANDGLNYSGATLLKTQTGGDFPRIAVDTSGGPNDGNVYMTYTMALGGNAGPAFTRSTDGGQSFSKPIPLPGGGEHLGVVVDPSGNVYVLSDIPKGSLDTVLVSRSKDGGLTFEQAVIAYSIVIPSFPLPGNAFRSGDPNQIVADSHGVYIVDNILKMGHSDVIFFRSTDGGLSWSSALAVSDKTEGQHFMPTIAVSEGIISVAWYDSRLGQLPNGTITGLDVFYAQSLDSGVSFSKNVRVTSVSFNPNLVTVGFFGKFIGDYISIAASPGAVHPIWTDNRNACDTIDPTFGCVDQDAYTATITGSLTSKSDQTPTSLTPFMTILAILATSTAVSIQKRRVKASRP